MPFWLGALALHAYGWHAETVSYPGEKPIVIHTLETFLLCSRFDRVYVGVHPQWLLHMQDLVDTFVPGQKDRVSLVPAAATATTPFLKW